ncbi:MAG: hypothetical protein II828_07335 [Clostridia bacterium]|nr:hypothetical protein [Clostridia bacterium]
MQQNMQQKIAKGVPVTAATLAGTVLLGIIGVSRRYGAIMPSWLTLDSRVGFFFLAAGLLLSLATAALILRYFIFFTRIQVVDALGNPLADNGLIPLGRATVRPIALTSAAALCSMILIGLGFGILFDPLGVYVLYLGAIALLSFTVATVIFLFSVVHHKIRRRFAWVAAGLFALLAVLFIMKAIPSIRDISVSDPELTAVTGTVSAASPSMGVLAGPGRTEIIIKGTSGESLSLRYSGSSSELQKGHRYTFYYLPHTKLIDKVAEAEQIVFGNS